MSMQKLYQVMQENPNLRQELKAAASDGQFTTKLCELAAERGLTISARELSASPELGDDELEAVVGGVGDGVGATGTGQNKGKSYTWRGMYLLMLGVDPSFADLM